MPLHLQLMFVYLNHSVPGYNEMVRITGLVNCIEQDYNSPKYHEIIDLF